MTEVMVLAWQSLVDVQISFSVGRKSLVCDLQCRLLFVLQLTVVSFI